uniref:Kinesin-like protein KIN-5C n=1 Tax=Cicer arietinum TaxID=3827 RepID=A0A1S3E1X4_CICAR|nr:kinesin-like protein KIN-5C [Cicer arietinum]
MIDVTCPVCNSNPESDDHLFMQTIADKQVDRVFNFDKVFGPKAQQRSIYDQAISPIVNEVLDGFNCTVFAYGQTGTGKTYTMEGGMRNKSGDLTAEAGVIPRAVRQIFDILEPQNADYSMKVTFLELYNKEITDLLSPEDNSTRPTEEKIKKPVALMEDGKGASKRRTSETLLNKRSSRSHSVFTITVYVKETVIGDDELIKCGKLNLVDLAGPENILCSGAREGRAREAGEVNKSLLTLGRVINALVEHSAHVPYRDSKLTRILRDSLGGKTKTCIIATISPSAYCLEETLSTLDYASRAKNIKNKPEANQKVSKAVLLKDLYMEIERMKEDVRAAREKNGVYISHERFAKEEAEKKERNEKIEQLENDFNLSQKQVDRFRELYLTEQEQKLDLENELKDCKVNLEKTSNDLHDLQENYRLIVSKLKEKECTISKLMKSENALIERAKEMCSDLQNASDDINLLSSKLDHKEQLEAENQKLILNFASLLNGSLKDLHTTIIGSISEHDVASIIIEYCNSNKLFDPEKKRKVICDEKLRTLLQRKSVNKNNIQNLPTSHFVENLEETDDIICAIISSNLKLVDLKRSLIEELLKKPEAFDGKVLGSFVRTKSDPNDYLQKNSHLLLPVIGINRSSKKEEINQEIMLRLLNVPKDVPICKISDDDFSESIAGFLIEGDYPKNVKIVSENEKWSAQTANYTNICQWHREEVSELVGSEKLRGHMGYHVNHRGGEILPAASRETELELEQKAKTLHEDIIKHWISRELALLRNHIDLANEKGWRREYPFMMFLLMLPQYMDRKLKLESPSEQSRLLSEIPKVIPEMVYTNMSPKDSSSKGKLDQNDLPELATGDTCNSKHGGFDQCMDKRTDVIVHLLLSSHSVHAIICHFIEILSTVTAQEPNTIVSVNSSIVQQLSHNSKIWKLPISCVNFHDLGPKTPVKNNHDGTTYPTSVEQLFVYGASQDKDTSQNELIQYTSKRRDGHLSVADHVKATVNDVVVADPVKVTINDVVEADPVKAVVSYVVEATVNDVTVLSDSDEEDVNIKNTPAGQKGVENPDVSFWNCSGVYYGETRGPFSMSVLKSWSDSAPSPLEFKVWKTGESEREAIPLRDALRLFFP